MHPGFRPLITKCSGKAEGGDKRVCWGVIPLFPARGGPIDFDPGLSVDPEPCTNLNGVGASSLVPEALLIGVSTPAV